MMGRSMPILGLFGMDGWRTCHPHSYSFLVLGITVARHCFCPILTWLRILGQTALEVWGGS